MREWLLLRRKIQTFNEGILRRFYHFFFLFLLSLLLVPPPLSHLIESHQSCSLASAVPTANCITPELTHKLLYRFSPTGFVSEIFTASELHEIPPF
jgi:hypothetical protein